MIMIKIIMITIIMMIMMIVIILMTIMKMMTTRTIMMIMVIMIRIQRDVHLDFRVVHHIRPSAGPPQCRLASKHPSHRVAIDASWSFSDRSLNSVISMPDYCHLLVATDGRTEHIIGGCCSCLLAGTVRVQRRATVGCF